jgi:hypothetical protein
LKGGFSLLLLWGVPLTGKLRIMETQFLSGKLIKAGVGIKGRRSKQAPHPFGSAFELCQTCFKLSNLILPV